MPGLALSNESQDIRKMASFRRHFLACLLCGIFGSLIAFIPHLAMKIQFGSWEFYHDQDEVLYRMIAKPAMDGSWKMRDVFVQADRNVPTNYSWMQFVPTSHLATTFGFNPISLGQFWRIFGGFGAGVAIYLVFSSFQIEKKKAIFFTSSCTLLALSDAGFAEGRVLFENFRLLYYWLVEGRTAKGEATAFTLYRVITPLWNLPVSLLAAACLSPALLWVRKWPALWGGLFTGLTVSLYFFQWTAILCGGGLCLGLYFIFDQWRKTEYRNATLVALIALCLGIAMGLPQILANADTFSSPEMKPILDRVGRGQVIPPGHPARWNNLFNRWAWIKIPIALTIAFRYRHRGLVLFTSIGAMAYLLSISAIITGLEFENWHYLYVINPYLAIPIYAGLVSFLIGRQKQKIALIIVFVMAATGFYLRYTEATLAPHAIEMREWFEGVRPMRNAIAATKDDGRVCLAGLQAGRILSLSMPGGRLLFHEPHSAHTSLMSDDEVIERYVLNYWLSGGSRESLQNRPSSEIFKMYIFADTRPEWDREQIRSRQLVVFDRLETGESAAILAKYEPKWLLLPVDSLKNPPNRGGKWEEAGQSERYVLWKLQGLKHK
jgi:hypothetical protein